MNKTQFLADRLREVFINGKWIANTNYKEQIVSINWEKATIKIEDLNTIALLIYHINYYLQGLLNVLNGGELEIKDKYSFDLPEIKSETDWAKLVDDFLTTAEKFANKVEQLDESILDHPFIDKKYGSYLRNIEGVIEHSYYHLGQIVIIKKIVLQQEGK